MSAAHRWLDLANRPTGALPRDALEERIERVLTLTNLGFMATSGRNGPICSPVEFYSENLDVYIYPQPNSPKVKALRHNPQMSFAVANSMAGWASAFGVQLFGAGELLEPGSPEWEHGMTVFKYPASNWEVGRPVDQVPEGELLRLRPDRITLTEHFLRRSGFAARQFWERDPDAAATRVATV
jgi:Pyridoxamine 5'-phosphate oxidase